MLGLLDFLWGCAEDREAVVDSVLRMMTEEQADEARAVVLDTRPYGGTLMQMAEMETIVSPYVPIKEEAKFVFFFRGVGSMMGRRKTMLREREEETVKIGIGWDGMGQRRKDAENDEGEEGENAESKEIGASRSEDGTVECKAEEAEAEKENENENEEE